MRHCAHSSDVRCDVQIRVYASVLEYENIRLHEVGLKQGFAWCGRRLGAWWNLPQQSCRGLLIALVGQDTMVRLGWIEASIVLLLDALCSLRKHLSSVNLTHSLEHRPASCSCLRLRVMTGMMSMMPLRVGCLFLHEDESRKWGVVH